MLIAIAVSVAAVVAGAYAADLLIPATRRHKGRSTVTRRKSPPYYIGPAVRGYDSPELHRELTLIRRRIAKNTSRRGEITSKH